VKVWAAFKLVEQAADHVQTLHVSGVDSLKLITATHCRAYSAELVQVGFLVQACSQPHNLKFLYMLACLLCMVGYRPITWLNVNYAVAPRLKSRCRYYISFQVCLYWLAFLRTFYCCCEVDEVSSH
jgi:hypothetical protein